MRASSFLSFFQAGFECSTHRLGNGRRLDLIASTQHDVLVGRDYECLRQFGIRTVREGLRWHLIEQVAGKYDFASMLPLLDAAEQHGMEQIIDLFHFGWPDHLDIFAPEFVDSFGNLALEFARLLKSRGVTRPYIAPMNEISFLSWGGGDVAYVNPFQHGRGSELKRQLVRAGIRAAEVFLAELPDSQVVWPDPVIHIAGQPGVPGDDERAEAYRVSMYEAWDMLLGRVNPELGGRPELVSMIGVNFYDRNEWINQGKTLERCDAEYRPFHVILSEVWKRYGVPLFVSETGIEDEKRPDWFAYIASEVRQARLLGVPVEGICLYPIVNHPGWDDDRHCYNGLMDYAHATGRREIYEPLAAEIRRQQILDSPSYRN